ncbi:MAG: DUF4383 domain-containing protein [Magnetospirillum sp.]|nr:DUF4383 domain-containing protein [Magnetospirillum sp.]
MRTRYYALVMGIFLIAFGILGFVPGLMAPPIADAPLRVGAGYGLLYALFPVNVLLNLVHLAFGVWGVVVWRSFGASRVFARTTAVVFAVLAVMGLLPVLRTTFGLMPLYGHDIWLHALIAIVSAYFGYAPIAAVETGTTARRP